LTDRARRGGADTVTVTIKALEDNHWCVVLDPANSGDC
jgi:hypothetical protein